MLLLHSPPSWMGYYFNTHYPSPEHCPCQLLGTVRIMEFRDGAMVRALASHQHDPDSIPGPSFICWLNLLLVLLLAPGFFSGFSSFPLSTKTNISKFQFNLARILRTHLKTSFNCCGFLSKYSNFNITILPKTNNTRTVASSSVQLCASH